MAKRKLEIDKEILASVKKQVASSLKSNDTTNDDSDCEDSVAFDTVYCDNTASNLFEKGGLIFENYLEQGCSAKDCIKHMFCSVCLPCNHDFLDDFEIRTHSLRIASNHFKKHKKCSGYGVRSMQGGFHYCKIARDGKFKMKFPNREDEYFEDEDDEDWDGNCHGVWFESGC
jgi:hypothetical protein